jgi:polysaccharide biosynthesis protein PslH
MKILLLTNKSPWPPRDGGASATMGMIDGLVTSGESVSVIAINTLKHFAVLSEPVPSAVKGIKLVPLNTRINPVKLAVNFLFSSYPYSLKRFVSPSISKIISSELSDSYDLVQIEGLAMTAYLPEIRKKFQGKVVYRPHNVENRIWEMTAVGEPDRFKRKYFRILAERTAELERKIINSFDGIAAMSDSDLDWFSKVGMNIPSAVIPPVPYGLNPGYSEGDPAKIFFLGALDWRPNKEGLIWFLKRVWPKVSSDFPFVEFHIAGRNPSKQLSKICRGKNIVFHGEIASAAEFIRKAQVMVVPLFSGSGVRIRIIEAMSLGKSIVASPLAAEGLLYTEGRDLLLARDEKDFAETIGRLLTDSQLREACALNAVENARKNYDILAATESLKKFYNRLS